MSFFVGGESALRTLFVALPQKEFASKPKVIWELAHKGLGAAHFRKEMHLCKLNWFINLRTPIGVLFCWRRISLASSVLWLCHKKSSQGGQMPLSACKHKACPDSFPQGMYLCKLNCFINLRTPNRCPFLLAENHRSSFCSWLCHE